MVHSDFSSFTSIHISALSVNFKDKKQTFMYNLKNWMFMFFLGLGKYTKAEWASNRKQPKKQHFSTACFSYKLLLWVLALELQNNEL